jgi:hypothetical protein
MRMVAEVIASEFAWDRDTAGLHAYCVDPKSKGTRIMTGAPAVRPASVRCDSGGEVR